MESTTRSDTPTGPFRVPRVLSPPSLVIAEDDVEMRRLLCRTLERDGYTVTEAGSGLQLFDELRRQRLHGARPDGIVTDIRMPGLSGLQALELIRSWGWSTPVVLVTAFADELIDEDVRGPETFLLSKPLEMDELRELVGSVVPGGAGRHCPLCGSALVGWTVGQGHCPECDADT